MDKNNTITINEKEYDVSSLSDEAKGLISHIGLIDNELTRLVHVQKSLAGGRQAAVTELIEMVEKKDD